MKFCVFIVSARSIIQKNPDYIPINENRIPRDIDNAETSSDDVNANFENKENVFAIFFCKPFLNLKSDVFSFIITFNLIRLINF